MSDKRWTKWRRWALMFASQHSLAESIDRTRFGRSPRCPVEDWSHPDETRDLIWIAAAAPEHISNSSTNISAMILTKGAPTMALRQPSIRTYSCGMRSEEHTSELQSLMRISYAVFCLNNKKTK